MGRHAWNRLRIGAGVLCLSGFLLILLPQAGAAPGVSFIGRLQKIKAVASAVPSNGDVNPYGVAVIPETTGNLIKGRILVSNFNNVTNAQGTGTAIDEIGPNGQFQLFSQIDAGHLPGPCPGGVGLTTALVVLRSGWVIVGSLPTSGGTSATAQAGCLIVLNQLGQPVETLSGGVINGPWDMTALDLGRAAVLFVSNVLNDTVAGGGSVVNEGTVVRIVLAIPDDGGVPAELARTVIASGFGERTDPMALVVGPTGLGLGADGTLYVADAVNSQIDVVPNAVTRNSVAGVAPISTGGAINGPLGLAIAPNGDILVVNGGDGNMVEVTPGGVQAAVENVDTTGAGAGTLFGLAIAGQGNGVYFVNDGNNTLNLLH